MYHFSGLSNLHTNIIVLPHWPLLHPVTDSSCDPHTQPSVHYFGTTLAVFAYCKQCIGKEAAAATSNRVYWQRIYFSISCLYASGSGLVSTNCVCNNRSTYYCAHAEFWQQWTWSELAAKFPFIPSIHLECLGSPSSTPPPDYHQPN